MDNNYMKFKELKEISSPLINQYVDFKEKYMDNILFFQIGDFYELYCEDAIYVSNILDLKLTKRTIDKKDIPMCGVPHHTGEDFANQLAKKGKVVTLIDQEKKNDEVIRKVYRTISPATITDDKYLEKDEHQYIMSLYSLKDELGCAIVDYLSGEIMTTAVRKYNIFDLIYRYQPKEVYLYLPQEWENELLQKIKNLNIVKIYNIPYFYDEMKPVIDEHKEKCFKDIPAKYSAIAAHYFLMEYLNKTHSSAVTLRKIQNISERNYMYLHSSAILNLELFENMQTRKKDKSLLGMLDKTVTPKGARLLKRWIEEPLINPKSINMRYSLVKYFLINKKVREEIRDNLLNTSDTERILARIENKRYSDTELCSLYRNIKKYKEVLNIMTNKEDLKQFSERAGLLYKNIDQLFMKMDKMIDEETIIKNGFSSEYDKIKTKKENGKNDIKNYYEKIKENTKIKNLKLEENKILGYFFEVTKSNLSLVPDYFIERGTVSSGKRYVTEELKNLEDEYNKAIEQYSLYYKDTIDTIIYAIKSYFSLIKNTVDYIAAMDIMTGFALLAEEKHFKCPILTDNGNINIKNGKHPLLYAFSYTKTIPNDCLLKNNSMQIITGPNMGGKSTYLKMVGMIIIMAQVGSFVPCDIEYTPVDRVLVRIGANDALLNNQSTFMMEMEEMSYILYHATENSLILIDELGRGTSTDDGISIAKSVLEYINKNLKSKTICSTHYHELIDMEKIIPNLKNYHADVIETKDGLHFTFKIKEGGIPKSFGIEVAKKAGLPSAVIETAEKYLNSLKE